MRKKARQQFSFVLLCISLPLCASAFIFQRATFAQQAIKDRKIIEWGWDSPSPTYLPDHIAEMEKIPFDGIVVALWANGHHDPHVRLDRQKSFPSRGWGRAALDAAEFSQDVDALKKTQFHRFTDNFLRFNTNPGDIDYFDDEGFADVVSNFALLAKIAKQTGMKGIMLDTESYAGVVFNYSKQRDAAKHTFEEYQQKARQRGREMMTAACREFPDIRVIVTLTYWMPHGLESDEPLPKHKYGLLPNLLDGFLEGATDNAMLIDGWEYAYNNRTKADYDRDLARIKTGSLQWTQVPDLMKKRWHASFGIWLDYDHKFDRADFNNNFFTPPEFAYAVHEALAHSDAYAWIWSEVPSWWNGQMPQPYIDALNQARKPDLQPPPPRKSPF